MEHETDLMKFLYEVADLRVRYLTEQAHQLIDFTKINKTMLDFVESVKDEQALKTLLNYEDLKNEYISLIINHLYIMGAKDSLMLYGILSKQISQ